MCGFESGAELKANIGTLLQSHLWFLSSRPKADQRTTNRNPV